MSKADQRDVRARSGPKREVADAEEAAEEADRWRCPWRPWRSRRARRAPDDAGEPAGAPRDPAPVHPGRTARGPGPERVGAVRPSGDRGEPRRLVAALGHALVRLHAARDRRRRGRRARVRRPPGRHARRSGRLGERRGRRADGSAPRRLGPGGPAAAFEDADRRGRPDRSRDSRGRTTCEGTSSRRPSRPTTASSS